MKRIVLFIFLFTVVILLGCGGGRYAKFSHEEDGSIVYKDRNFTLLEPSIGPNELANAEATLIMAKSQEAITHTLAQKMGNGETGGISVEGKFVGVIINDDPYEPIWVPHPEMSLRIMVPANQSRFIYTSVVPSYLTFYNRYNRYSKIEIKQIDRPYNKVETNFTLRVHSVNKS